MHSRSNLCLYVGRHFCTYDPSSIRAKVATTNVSSMQLLLSGLALTTLLVGPVAPLTAISTAPVNVPDISGNYVISFYQSGGETHAHDFTLTQASAGVLSGFGGYPSGERYTQSWHVSSGNRTDTHVDLTIVFDTGGTLSTMHLQGTIAADGSLAGNWSDNSAEGRSGTWKSTAYEPLLEEAGSGQ